VLLASLVGGLLLRQGPLCAWVGAATAVRPAAWSARLPAPRASSPRTPAPGAPSVRIPQPRATRTGVSLFVLPPGSQEKVDPTLSGALAQLTTYFAEVDQRLQALEAENKDQRMQALEAENKDLRQEVAKLQRLQLATRARVSFDMTDHDFSDYAKGKAFRSKEFALLGNDRFLFELYPKGDRYAKDGSCSLYIRKNGLPFGGMFRVTLDGTTKKLAGLWANHVVGQRGWMDFGPAADSFSTLVFEVPEVDYRLDANEPACREAAVSLAAAQAPRSWI